MTVHLSILIFFPALFAVVGALAPPRGAPWIGLFGTLVALCYAVILLFDFNYSSAGLQYVTDDKWIPELGIRYSLGVDGLNLWLVALTTLLFATSALWIALRQPDRPKLFSLHFGIAEAAVLGAFLAQDLALFVLFFDLMLVPFYFLVGQWGGPERVRAALKMFIYTLVGSLLMLAGAVAVAVLAGTDGPNFSLAFLRENLVGRQHAEAAVRGLRAGVPDQDAGVPLPRLDAGRVPQHAAAGARRVLRRGVEGGRLRSAADRAAAVPGRRRRLADDHADPGGAVDPLRLDPGVHADEPAADPRLLVGRPARVHRARDLRVRRRARAAPRARCCRRSTTGSWWRRCS